MTANIEALKLQIEGETQKLRGLLSRRSDLNREIEALRNRLVAFRQSLAIVTGEPVPAETFSEDGAKVTHAGLVKPVIRHPDPWEDALGVMQARGGPFTTDEILTEARSRGSDIHRVRVRSRLAHLVDSKKLTRMREGIFIFPLAESEEDRRLIEAAKRAAWDPHGP